MAKFVGCNEVSLYQGSFCFCFVVVFFFSITGVKKFVRYTEDLAI